MSASNPQPAHNPEIARTRASLRPSQQFYSALLPPVRPGF